MMWSHWRRCVPVDELAEEEEEMVMASITRVNVQGSRTLQQQIGLAQHPSHAVDFNRRIEGLGVDRWSWR